MHQSIATNVNQSSGGIGSGTGGISIFRRDDGSIAVNNSSNGNNDTTMAGQMIMSFPNNNNPVIPPFSPFAPLEMTLWNHPPSVEHSLVEQSAINRGDHMQNFFPPQPPLAEVGQGGSITDGMGHSQRQMSLNPHDSNMGGIESCWSNDIVPNSNHGTTNNHQSRPAQKNETHMTMIQRSLH